jgi:uncharacterized protein YjbI with pentapeptide repeats
MTAAELLAQDTFEGETFVGLDLQHAALAEKEFFRCTFENCLLQESRWKRSRLEACVLRGCDLTRAAFPETGLRGVRFEKSKLMGIDFTPVSSNPELSFEDCDLRYASFSELNLRQATFLRCVAREANFLQVDLSDADFAGTELLGANFTGCSLTRTDFRLATGLALDPRRNSVKDTQVAVEAAVALAHGMGLVVAGYGEVAKPKGKKRP